jgi:hypothetical protein
MEIAVFAWHWLAAIRPELEIRMIIELYSAWEWLMDSRKGLFYLSEE